MLITLLFLFSAQSPIPQTRLDKAQIECHDGRTCITLARATKLDPAQLPAGCRVSMVHYDDGHNEPMMTCHDVVFWYDCVTGEIVDQR